MTKQITTYIIGIILGWSAYAQVPAPAPAQSEPIAIMNATAHLGNGEVIENAIITFKEGKIALVADATRVRVDLKGYRLIEAAGKHAYPGVILPLTNLGLVEYNAVKASRDFSETGDLKPHVRTAIAYNTDSELIPTMCISTGLLFLMEPDGGWVRQSAVKTKSMMLR